MGVTSFTKYFAPRTDTAKQLIYMFHVWLNFKTSSSFIKIMDQLWNHKGLLNL